MLKVTAYKNGEIVEVKEYTKKRDAYGRAAAWRTQGYTVIVEPKK